MNDPWGNPSKINGAVDFANKLLHDLSGLEKQLNKPLDKLNDSSVLRKEFFLIVLQRVKSEHAEGADNYGDVGYILDRIMEEVFHSEGLNVTNKFYSDGLFVDIKKYWENLQE